MSPWDEIEALLTDDLHSAVAHAHALGSRAQATPFVSASAARFLGIGAPRLAIALVCGATTDAGVRAFHDHDGWVLSGDAGAVPWGDEAATLLIAARTEPSLPASPLGLFAVDAETHGVIRTPRTSIGSAAMSNVDLAGVRVSDSSRVDDGVDVSWPAVVRALDKAAIVAAAELAGLAQGALDAAVAYATAREQFGAPIATYQALAHRLADMAIATDAAELAVEEATGSPTPPNASRAKIIANDAAHRVTAGLHQINGGVGFYADQTPPAYYARALALRVEMGDSAIHRRQLAGHLA
ncbi:MAG TPA: acyl-CoA dehydrogenase family protein [Acidimicrobiales bacterium]|nr:acyl-CoA dehydrogenase family protein [Acidimicrobiales bacterium]